jgi:hypothetical protein
MPGIDWNDSTFLIDGSDSTLPFAGHSAIGSATQHKEVDRTWDLVCSINLPILNYSKHWLTTGNCE